MIVNRLARAGVKPGSLASRRFAHTPPTIHPGGKPAPRGGPFAREWTSVEWRSVSKLDKDAHYWMADYCKESGMVLTARYAVSGLKHPNYIQLTHQSTRFQEQGSNF